MVLFVYSVISPLTNFVLAFVFLALGTLLRHQFIYIYPTVPDSGGKIWVGFIKIMVTCMIIGEVTSECFSACDAPCSGCCPFSPLVSVTVLGLLGLKKASIATPIFIPLLVSLRLLQFFTNDAANILTRHSIRHAHRSARFCSPITFAKSISMWPSFCPSATVSRRTHCEPKRSWSFSRAVIFNQHCRQTVGFGQNQ